MRRGALNAVLGRSSEQHVASWLGGKGDPQTSSKNECAYSRFLRFRRSPLFASYLSMAEAARKRESSSEREMPVCKYARLETPVSGRDESCAVATVQPSPGVPERACLRGSAMAEKDLKNEVAQEDVLRECIESEVEAPRAMLDCELSNLNVDWTRLLERGETRLHFRRGHLF